jgi:hypothetical protein
MISRHIARDRNFGRPNVQHVDQGLFQHPLAEALRNMVMAEFRFGAQITFISPTEIRLVTMCAGDRDSTEFFGTEEEMRPLVEAARHYTEHCRRNGRLVICTELVSMLDRLPHGTAANPDFQRMVMPFVTVENGLQHCLLAPLGLPAEDVELGLTMRLEDVDTALQLMTEMPTMSFREVVAATNSRVV